MVGGKEVRITREELASRHLSGTLNRDVDADLLALVMAGCGIEEIVHTLCIRLDEVHRRLRRLRLVIEDVARVTSER